MDEHKTYLAHHGIKGMKWGVRRYQNKDGSLTPAGKKRYDSMTGDQLYKNAKKQIRKERARQYGWDNQWRWDKTIGDNSKRALDARNKAIEEAKNDPKYKAAMAKLKKMEKQYLDKFEDRYDYKKSDYEKFLKEYDDVLAEADKASRYIYEDLGTSARVVGGGKRFATSFVNGYGKDISVGYLKDLGFEDTAARKYVETMAKSGWTLGGE